MNIFKKLAGICMAVALCFGVCAFTACGGNNDDGSSFQPQADAYNFQVVNADGSAAEGYRVQLCKYKDNGELETCYSPVKVDSQGYCAYTCPNGAGVFEIHLLPAGSSDGVEFTGDQTTPDSYSTDIIVLTLVA